MDLGEFRSDRFQLLKKDPAINGPEAFLGLVALLRRINAEPYLMHFRPRRPEPAEVGQVPAALEHLPCYRAVHRDLLTGYIFEYAVISSRRTPHIVFGGETIDRNHQMQ